MQQEHDDDVRRWHLAGKVLTGALLREEEAEWAGYLRDVGFRTEFERVTAYWDSLGKLPYDRIDSQQDWQTVLARARDSRTEGAEARPVRWLRYAAAVIAVVVVAGLSWWVGRRSAFRAGGDAVLTTVEAPAGSKTYVTLPDSSSVWLNAGSRLTFMNDFGRTHRHVDLVGEAFFDVKKRTTPFEVYTDAYAITVLGTAFNVQAYADDDRVSTTLVRGSLRVSRAGLMGSVDDVVLVPNDRLVFTKRSTGGVAALEHNIRAEQSTAWKDGWLAVSGESLSDLARKMERLYDITIDFEDSGLEAYRFSGRIRQLSLEQVLKALSLTAPVDFSIREKHVVLRENTVTSPTYKSLQNHP